MAYAMGGRTAEEVVFHDPTTGASNDIEKATNIARQMVLDYGFSDKLGAIKWSDDEQSDLGSLNYGYSRTHRRNHRRGSAQTGGNRAYRSVERHQRESQILTSSYVSCSSRKHSTKRNFAEIFANVKKAPKREVWLSDSKPGFRHSRRFDSRIPEEKRRLTN